MGLYTFAVVRLHLYAEAEEDLMFSPEYTADTEKGNRICMHFVFILGHAETLVPDIHAVRDVQRTMYYEKN